MYPWVNKDFQTPLELENKMMSRCLLLCPSFTKKEMFKKFTDFFQQYTNMHPCIQCFILQIKACDYVLFLQIRSHIIYMYI